MILFFRKKLTATAITITTFMTLMMLAVGIFWFTMTQSLSNYLNQQTDVLGSSLATQAAFNATQSILTNDLLSLNVLLNRLVVDDSILSARVFNKKDELLAEADSGKAKHSQSSAFRPSKDHRVYTSSIRFRNEVVGHVLITLDKTPAQDTLQHLQRLLLGIAIFMCAIALLLVVLMTRWLFSPIREATYAINALAKGHQDALLPASSYHEGRKLCQAIHKAQQLDWPKPIIDEQAVDDLDVPAKTQMEIDFDRILAESKKRSCLLYIDLVNIEEWHDSMTPLQVANLLTPIYRAIFQACEQFYGQVHQYHNDSVLVLFNAEDSGEHLYLEAITAAHVIMGLIKQLLEHELYDEAPKLNLHLGLHKGTPHLTQMMKTDRFDATEIAPLLEEVRFLSQSSSLDSLVISDAVFTMNEIQNRVFTRLPEIIETGSDDMLAYPVKGLADKYQKRVQQYIQDLGQPHDADLETDNTTL